MIVSCTQSLEVKESLVETNLLRVCILCHKLKVSCSYEVSAMRKFTLLRDLSEF